jgi:hypothetical protein
MKVQHTYIADLPGKTFLANNSYDAIRIMGVLVEIGNIPDHDVPYISTLMMLPVSSAATEEYTLTQQQHVQQQLQTLTIDDGTDILTFWVETKMIESIVGTESSSSTTTATTTTNGTGVAVELGKTYDCILKLRQTASIRRWFADTLILVVDPMDEHLRWIQLSHHNDSVLVQGSQPQQQLLQDTMSSTPPVLLHLNHEYGYPTRKRDASEVYRMICVQAKLSSISVQRKQEKQQLHQRRNHHHQQQHPRPRWKRQRLPILHAQQHTPAAGVHPKAPSQPPPAAMTPSSSSSFSSIVGTPAMVVEGVLLQDLALVLQIPIKRVQEVLLDLQLQGQVYQNEKGQYLPL